jgi:Xaa-Pro aminopeptidase
LTDLYARRRERFMHAMGDGVALFVAPPERPRSNDTHYEYRPDSEFYYLTGFPEPDAFAILSPGGKEGAYTLLVRPRDPAQEAWTGRRAGVEGARDRYGADRALPIDELAKTLQESLTNQERVLFRLGASAQVDAAVLRAVRTIAGADRTGVWAPHTVVDPGEILSEMRLRKSSEDLTLLRRAIEMSVAGHRTALRAIRPGLHEYELEAIVEYVFRRSGSPAPGYSTIVGSGPNACILHYRENTRRMQDGELVLVDAGAEWECFTGDITRTYPVGGRFTPEQERIYRLVLDAQTAALACVRPGARFQDTHDAAVNVLARGLLDLGFLQGPLSEVLEKEAYKKFYLHKTSHWLGMDVHDAGKYRVRGEWRTLEPGMVLTVEPGLYIPAGSEGVPREYWDIGVRIEDDVLVTPDGHEVLTAGLPKQVADVERELSAPRLPEWPGAGGGLG